MNIKSLMKVSLAPLALVFAQAVSAAPVTSGDVSQMMSDCRNIDSRAAAASCLEPFREAANRQTSHIVSALQAEGIAADAIRQNFEQECLEETTPSFADSGLSPEEYLRDAQICLVEATDKAEEQNVNFDNSATSYLIAVMRRLRRLDI